MSQAKILVVDDNQDNLIATSLLLNKLDVEVITVDNGNDALAAALKYDLALIIMDVQMPNMDGYEVTRILNDDVKTQHIPIIIVTAVFRDEQHLIEGYKCGAVDYIEKPIHDIIFKSKVKVFVRLWKQQKALEREVSLRIKAYEEINHLATHDPLTGLANRILFADLIDKAIANAKRHDFKVAVLFIDFDGFKLINDEYGHEAGDYVLKICAQEIMKTVREMDTVARYGGDEYIALLTELQDSEEILTLAERIRDSISQPLIWQGHQLKITVSIGIAVYPEHGDTEGVLIHKADQAMYSVKEIGKDAISFFEEHIT